MRKAYKILRALIIASILLFLIVILVIYAYMPENPAILFSTEGIGTFTITRSQFFYSIFSLFSIIQLTGYLFNNFILRQQGESLKSWYIQTWLSINIFMALLVLFIGLANNSGNYTFQSVVAVGYIGPIIVFLSLISLPVYLFRKKV